MVIVAERLAAVFCLARSPTAPPKRFQTTVLRSTQQLSAPHLNLGRSELPRERDKVAYSGIMQFGSEPVKVRRCAAERESFALAEQRLVLRRLKCPEQPSLFQTP
jgi:hypothetical protein